MSHGSDRRGEGGGGVSGRGSVGWGRRSETREASGGCCVENALFGARGCCTSPPEGAGGLKQKEVSSLRALVAYVLKQALTESLCGGVLARVGAVAGCIISALCVCVCVRVCKPHPL